MQAERITSVKRIGDIETIDIEVDNESHVFFANGIATSNSHSVSYSVISYWTAYQKAHHTIKFYEIWLKHSKNRLKYKEELRNLISEAKSFGIEILPPSVEIGNRDFQASNNSIYFGLDDIKGCRFSEVEKLKEKNPQTWIEFLSLNLNKTTVISLIKTGCIKFSTSRKRMLYEYDIWLELTEREKNFIINNKYQNIKEGITGILSADYKQGGPNARRKPEIESLLKKTSPLFSLDDTQDGIIEYETELLGLPLTYTPLDGKDFAFNITCKEFDDGKGNFGDLLLPCVIKSVKEYKIKNGKNAGQIMGFLDVEDNTGFISAVVFSNTWREYKSLMYPGNPVCLKGKRSKEASFQVISIHE